MPASAITSQTFDNGLTLLVEPMPDVQSASFSIMVPAGSIYQSAGTNGTASVLAEMITRGAGSRSSRELAAALDTLGVQRSESVGWNFLAFSGATLADYLTPTLEIYADIVLRPHLAADEFDPAREGVEQGLLAIEDEPQRKALIELRRRCYDAPWGLPTEGELSELETVTHAHIGDFYAECFRPNGTIVAVAGNVDPAQIADAISKLFGAWPSRERQAVERGLRGPRADHLELESAQTQIALAWQGVPYSHPDYYAAWAAVAVLSGGSSSRLFTEVREKRGLCYSVYATLNSLLVEGRVLAYAGTTTERAQETLDVMLTEIARLGEAIGEDELARCKARAKSALIMQQESTMSRAGSLARDWFHLGRIVTLDEVRSRIDALTVNDVLDYVRNHPANDITLLTIGAAPLAMAKGA